MGRESFSLRHTICHDHYYWFWLVMGLMNIDMIDLLVENDIHLYCLPPHTTNKFQPCDVAIFRPLKAYFSWLTDMVKLASLRQQTMYTFRGYFRNWGQCLEDTKKGHFFYYKKVKKGTPTPNLPPPAMFIASLHLFW